MYLLQISEPKIKVWGQYFEVVNINNKSFLCCFCRKKKQKKKLRYEALTFNEELDPAIIGSRAETSRAPYV